jgi:hypothetical protein
MALTTGRRLKSAGAWAMAYRGATALKSAE